VRDAGLPRTGRSQRQPGPGVSRALTGLDRRSAWSRLQGGDAGPGAPASAQVSGPAPLSTPEVAAEAAPVPAPPRGPVRDPLDPRASRDALATRIPRVPVAASPEERAALGASRTGRRPDGVAGAGVSRAEEGRGGTARSLRAVPALGTTRVARGRAAPSRAALLGLLADPVTVRVGVLAAEVLGPPVSLRDPLLSRPSPW
jgi:hypothetical protein